MRERTVTERLIAEAKEQLKSTVVAGVKKRHYIRFEGKDYPADVWEMSDGLHLYMEFEIKIDGGLMYVPPDLEMVLMRGNTPAIEEPFPVTLARGYTLNNSDVLAVDLTFDTPIDLGPELRTAVWGDLTIKQVGF